MGVNIQSFKTSTSSQDKMSNRKDTTIQGVSPEKMSKLEALATVGFGVMLPTVDVVTDLAFAVKLFKWKASKAVGFCYDVVESKKYLYGAISLIFPSVNFILVTRHWSSLEDPKKLSSEERNSRLLKRRGSGRCKTLPIHLLQLWPQYRAMRIIYLGLLKQDPNWRKEEEVLLEKVSTLEPFTESVPNCYWILYIYQQTGNCLMSLDPREDMFGAITYASSVLSATYGLTNFLRVGPLKVIPKEPASGFGHHRSGHECYIFPFLLL